MALSIRTDSQRAGGGYALLEGPGLAEVTAVSVENCSSGQFLGEDGRWKKTPFAFPVETTSAGALSFGPHIVDFVPTELLVALHAQDGRELGRLFWVDVLPSRNPGAVTSAQVFEDRRRQADAKAAAEAARLKDEDARRAADRETANRRAAEDADRKRAQDDAEAKHARDKVETEEQERVDALAREQEEARRKAEEDAKQRDPEQKDAECEKQKHRPMWGRLALVSLLVLVLGAATAFALVPGLRNLFKSSQPEKEAHVVPLEKAPPKQPRSEPARTPPPPQAPPVDCARTYGSRLEGVRRLADADKLELGADALRDGCGRAAFDAFDAAGDGNEEADWNIARFYDPNETRPVYRNVGRVHPDWAAEIYHRWRGRSTRQAAALRKICETTNSGGASLRRSCAR